MDRERGHVLVAEDDDRVRASVARVLVFEGYRVDTASDGDQALAMTVDLRPDLLLLDVLMPGLDGLAACRRLRSAGDRTPVLMLTARHEVQDRVAGLDAGAAGPGAQVKLRSAAPKADEKRSHQMTIEVKRVTSTSAGTS